MLDMAVDNAIADHQTYGNVELQHHLFARLRRGSQNNIGINGICSAISERKRL
jgi:hypothetical protein